MKTTKILKWLPVLAICLAAVGCTEDDNNDLMQVDCYIAGYDGGAGVIIEEDYGVAHGYFIITTDLKDTLLTYDLPIDIYDFPVKCFCARPECTPTWFPNSFKKEFKVRISYTIASEEEKVYPVYRHDIFTAGLNGISQIIIKSAIKLEE